MPNPNEIALDKGIRSVENNNFTCYLKNDKKGVLISFQNGY